MIKNNKGYTLIELLAVIIIMVTTGTIIVGILVVSLRGGNKGSNINQIRENGNFIISQMSKSIAYAKNFQGVSADGVSFIKDCGVLPPAPTPPPTPVKYKYVKFATFDGGVTVYSCNSLLDNPPNTIASGSAQILETGGTLNSLLDNTKFTVSDCSFYCTQLSTTVSPTIDINFTIVSIGTGVTENTNSVTFQTSVKPRN